jgi:hypothetical protein
MSQDFFSRNGWKIEEENTALLPQKYLYPQSVAQSLEKNSWSVLFL